MEDCDYLNKTCDYRHILCKKHDVHILQLSIIYFIVVLTGLIGNAVVIMIYGRQIALKTITDVCILNLAISDIVLLFTLPLKTMYQWNLGSVIYELTAFIYTFNFTSSAFLLTYIALDRYYVIVKRQWLKIQILWFILLWSLAILFSLPKLIFSIVRDKFVYSTVYIIEQTQFITEACEIVLRFLIPLIAFIICYRSIALKLKKWCTLYILIGLITIFFITQLPYNAVKLCCMFDVLYHFITDCSISKNLDYALHVTKDLTLIHACLNPILYTCIDSSFRKQFLDRLIRKKSEIINFDDEFEI